jgi:hypothetical protein
MLNWSSPLELSIFGPVGETCQIEAIEDLAPTNSWKTVANFVLTNNPATWADPANKPQRFYRAVLQP